MKVRWILYMLVFASCSKEQANDCFTSLGDDGNLTTTVEKYKRLNVTDRLRIELVNDSSRLGDVDIKGPENLLEQIDLEVTDSTLFVSNTNTCNFVRSYDYEIVVTLYVHQLEELSIFSVAEVVSEDTLEGIDLRINHEALSDLTLKLNYSNDVYVRSFSSAKTILSGEARTLRGSIEEISDLDARDLVCKDVLIDNHSQYDCFVNGTEILYINIFNSGNVYYVQEPTNYKVLNIKRGVGDLIKL